MSKTSERFRAIGEEVAFALGDKADVVQRFEDEPTLAVEAHVADLSTPTGVSVLYGQGVEDPQELGATGRASVLQRVVSMVIISRYAPEHIVAGVEDIERLDDLDDAVMEALDTRKNERLRKRLFEEMDLMAFNMLDRTPVPSGELSWAARELRYYMNIKNIS